MWSPFSATVAAVTFFTMQHFNILSLFDSQLPDGDDCPTCNSNGTTLANDSVTNLTVSAVENVTALQNLSAARKFRRIPIVTQFAPSRRDCDLAFLAPIKSLLSKRYRSRFATARPVRWAPSLNVPTESRWTHFPIRRLSVSREFDEKIRVTCEDVFKRGDYDSSEHSEFPIAYVRTVYKDYHMQELLLNLLYSRWNVFCYSIDRKSSRRFHSQMRHLAECFPNVFLVNVEYNVDSAGHNMDRSYLQCLRQIRHIPGWKYAILLQNDDIPLKTNDEIVAILKALNGSNDVGAMRPIKTRIPKWNDWTFSALQLFRNQSENDDRVLRISKGSTAASLSRAFVEFVTDRLNLTTLLRRFDTVDYGVDEMLIPSLNAEDALEAPGGFTRRCVAGKNRCITRYVVWSWSGLPCRSGRYRHHVCVFGLSDIGWLNQCRQLFANKMIAAYDYGSIACWARHLVQRRLARRVAAHTHRNRVDFDYYSALPIVRFNKDKDKWRENITEFKCA